MWLIGMMGSGKTSVGRLTAQRLDVPFYDTDDAVVASAGVSIAEIWEHGGEGRFRRLERTAIENAPHRAIAAAGGGAVVDPQNRELMERRKPVIWLRARPETLARRLETFSDRPLLREGTERVEMLRQILMDRTAAYQAVSTHIVNTDHREPADVAEEVSRLWPR